MANTINGDSGAVSGTAGLKSTSDGTGILALQTNGTTAITVDASQNVGIGVTSPTQKLELNSGYVKVGNGVGGGGGVWFPYSSDAAGRTWRARSDIVGYGDWGLEQSTTQTGTTFATKMLIDASGNLMVGATATTYGERLKITFPNTQGIHLNESTSSSSVNYQYFTKGSTPTNVGAIYYNGSVMAYQTTSDYRLKENIAPMTGALAKIAELKPVTYTWKDNQRDGEGFIAHELQEHFPDAVSGTKDEIDEYGNPKYQGYGCVYSYSHIDSRHTRTASPHHSPDSTNHGIGG